MNTCANCGHLYIDDVDEIKYGCLKKDFWLVGDMQKQTCKGWIPDTKRVMKKVLDTKGFGKRRKK